MYRQAEWNNSADNNHLKKLITMINNKKEKLFIYLIYPKQCVICLLDGDSECRLEIEDCVCKNYVPVMEVDRR